MNFCPGGALSSARASNLPKMAGPEVRLFDFGGTAPSPVIACDKRKAFAQGSDSDEAIQLRFRGLWIALLTLAMTVSNAGGA